MKNIKITLSYESFKYLIELIGVYTKHHKNLEFLILQSLRKKLWNKAAEIKDVKLSFEPYQAHAIKEVLLLAPNVNGIPLAELNELRNAMFKLDEELTGAI